MIEVEYRDRKMQNKERARTPSLLGNKAAALQFS
jgi:hypothetical protein